MDSTFLRFKHLTEIQI